MLSKGTTFPDVGRGGTLHKHVDEQSVCEDIRDGDAYTHRKWTVDSHVRLSTESHTTMEMPNLTIQHTSGKHPVGTWTPHDTDNDALMHPRQGSQTWDIFRTVRSIEHLPESELLST